MWVRIGSWIRAEIDEAVTTSTNAQLTQNRPGPHIHAVPNFSDRQHERLVNCM